ncbi:spore coat protein GerQ [Paenibacillus sp. GYB003]|uniref:spore coat protein GerQ n=1 Tax=Paenibacillus sp. GYB003 TaxID=2994392 RepID=UPI002F966C1E
MNANAFRQSAAAPQYYYYPMGTQSSGSGSAPGSGTPVYQTQQAATPPGIPPGTPSGLPAGMPTGVPGAYPSATYTPPGMLPAEESFVENILRLNLGKTVTLYMTYENNSQWNAKIFRGVLEAAGRDHIIISDPKTGMRYLLLMVNLDYATFDEPLQYTYPFR